jgi:predicted ribosome-associated RNA-binding protein Tma20
MEYVVEMCSGAVIYIPGIIKIDSGIKKLMRGDVGIHT